MSDILYADPFLKNINRSKSALKDSVLICTYGVWVEIDTFTEVSLLRRTKAVDELWVVLDPSNALLEKTSSGLVLEKGFRKGDCTNSGLAYVAPRTGDEVTASMRLLRKLFRDRIHYMQPLQLEIPGLLDEAAFIELTGGLQDSMQVVSKSTTEAEPEIVKVAHQLLLNPHPSGTDVDCWLARCPETNHHLHISASGESFWCGWCRRKGGADELHAFNRERQ